MKKKGKKRLFRSINTNRDIYSEHVRVSAVKMRLCYDKMIANLLHQHKGPCRYQLCKNRRADQSGQVSKHIVTADNEKKQQCLL